MTHEQVSQYLLGLPGVRLDYPFGKDVAVYKIGAGQDAKMFALLAEDKQPPQVSLKCDPQLSEVLREKYETVMPGYHLNKKHWNTIVLSGQLEWEQVCDLIQLSYDLVA